MNEVEEARERHNQAWRNFENADSEHIDAAIYELNAAQEKFMNALRRADSAGHQQAYQRTRAIRSYAGWQ